MRTVRQAFAEHSQQAAGQPRQAGRAGKSSSAATPVGVVRRLLAILSAGELGGHGIGT
jgi:hypothetical protein